MTGGQSKENDSCWLILTVGTGTAGRHSNLAAGLRRTIEILAPVRFLLVPSRNEISHLTADLVREGLDTFEPWDEDTPYHCIESPDSLEQCRRTVGEVIAAAQGRMGRKNRLLVNPTSGTKQMSVGAALAALDEGIGEIVFTVGERVDGVVRTGTECLEIFDPAKYFAERDLAVARRLFHSGAYAASAALLSRHPTLQSAAAIAACRHAWECQNYTEARRIAAAALTDELIRCRNHLEQLHIAAANRKPDERLVADILHTAETGFRRQDWNEALLQACRAFEMGLRRALERATGLSEPIELNALRQMPIPAEVVRRAENTSNDGITTILNLNAVARILAAYRQPMGDAFLSSRKLKASTGIRNERMHGLRAVTENEARLAIDTARHALASLELPIHHPRPDLARANSVPPMR